jgi:adenine-specific DNA-methyltransferase
MTAESYWDPFSVTSWANLLGLTHENLFGHIANDSDRRHSVLLDGLTASFEFSHVKDTYFDGDDALSWTWSANMRHCVIVNELHQRLFVRRWDAPSEIRQFKLPTREGAHSLLTLMHNSKTPRNPDVIKWVLELFKYLLANIGDTSVSLTVLNQVLMLAREHSLGTLTSQELHSEKPVDLVKGLLGLHPDEAIRHIDDTRLIAPISYCLEYLTFGPRQFGLTFRADLLFRHAASQLYQQAHLLVERDVQQYLPGLAPEPRFSSGPKEVRYTPNNLARSLVQQGLNALLDGNTDDTIDIYDPACGSGIFLQECIRECVSRHLPASVAVNGSDISPIAVQITNACLSMSIAESSSPQSFRPNITQGDSLITSWPESDLILMNPPFCSWQNMSDSDREVVSENVRGLGLGRTDKAMAFVWKAIQALRPGGVLAAVLPRALLDNQSAADLRAEIGKSTDIVMLGRFEGFSYFEHSLVETAFVILRKHRAANDTPAVRILIAEKGWEDASLRLLRGAEPTAEETANVEMFEVRSEFFVGNNWMPRRQTEMQLLETLEQRHFPPIEDLFEVQQGIRTGNKKAFLLSHDDLHSLPTAERKYFRKAAGQGAIVQGQLLPNEYVFYPYNSRGQILADEPAMRRSVPNYFEGWLLPHEDKLKTRQWAPTWWLPERPRQWQYEHRQKIVSTYFGKPGAFAYDEDGDYVVVEGFAWNWTYHEVPISPTETVPFFDTLLPFAYLALLNSEVFERIIACFSWRLQGGQLRLERRFLAKVPVPNLATDEFVSRSVVESLIRYGQGVAKGELEDNLEAINDLAAEAYRLPYALFADKG